MPPPPAIWVDHRDTVLRRGMLTCLGAASWRVAGESAGLEPMPDPDRAGVLIFEVDESLIPRAVTLGRRTGIQLVGIIGEDRTRPLSDLQRLGLAAALGARTLTPKVLLAVLRAITRDHGAAPSRPAGRMLVANHARRGLTEREVDVLRLLADGATTRDIAERMNYSERTVKNIVHALLGKLHGRTRAQAVAIAAWGGMI